MDPISPPTGHHRAGGQPGEPDPQTSLVDVVDQALVRLDGLRDRPALSTAVTGFLVFLLALGWVLTQWREVEPIDEHIPRAGEVVATVDDAGKDQVAGSLDDDLNRGDVVSGRSDDGSGAGDGPATGEAFSVPPEPMVVHVSGAVLRQGLVELERGSRLADAVAAAGGPTASADVHRLNLATPVADGMHIRVPEVGEDLGDSSLPLVETSGGGATGGDGGVSPGEVEIININTAGSADLERLPGIGPAIAAAIIAWRDDNGPFTSTDDLLDVPGIGPAKLAAIEAQVTP